MTELPIIFARLAAMASPRPVPCIVISGERGKHIRLIFQLPDGGEGCSD
ncbi:hypothetical protein [Sodalis sp.]